MIKIMFFYFYFFYKYVRNNVKKILKRRQKRGKIKFGRFYSFNKG